MRRKISSTTRAHWWLQCTGNETQEENHATCTYLIRHNTEFEFEALSWWRVDGCCSVIRNSSTVLWWGWQINDVPFLATFTVLYRVLVLVGIVQYVFSMVRARRTGWLSVSRTRYGTPVLPGYVLRTVQPYRGSERIRVVRPTRIGSKSIGAVCLMYAFYLFAKRKTQRDLLDWERKIWYKWFMLKQK